MTGYLPMTPPILIQMISFFITSIIMERRSGLRSDQEHTAAPINHSLK